MNSKIAQIGRNPVAEKDADNDGDSARRFQERLSAIVQLSDDAIVGKSLDGFITDWNPGAQRIFGYSAAEAVGQPISLIIPDDRLDEESEIIAKISAGKGVDPLETVRRAKDGRLLSVSLVVAPIHDDARRVIGASNVTRDISEQKRAEVDRSRLLKLMDFTKLIVRGGDDRITQWNRGSEMLYGYSAHEAVGSISHELLGTRFPEPLPQIMRHLREHGHWEGELKHITKDGREIVVTSEWLLFPGDYGQSPSVLESNIDVTELRAGEKALRASEERYRALFASMSEGFCLCEAIFDERGEPIDFRFLAVNPAYARILGRKAEEIEGNTARSLLPGTEQYWIDVLCKPAITGEVVRYTNFAREVGRYFDVYVFSPEKGKFAALTMDVTDRQSAKDVLARQAEALARSNVELERFAHIASHDLQEPLRTVGSFARLLHRRHAAELTGEAAEYLAFITQGVERMETLIRDLLSYSRVDSRAAAFTAAECNVIVAKVIESLKSSIDDQQAQVTADALPAVIGDATQLGQVFQNLIANALKFHGKEPPRIHVSGGETPLEWIFNVQDNGIGIAPQYFERIFVLFQRLHTTEEYAGTGIGLAVCKKIIERHHGKIWVESNVGEGSTFHFSISKKRETR